jgi:hypothetical protein
MTDAVKARASVLTGLRRSGTFLSVGPLPRGAIFVVITVVAACSSTAVGTGTADGGNGDGSDATGGDRVTPGDDAATEPDACDQASGISCKPGPPCFTPKDHPPRLMLGSCTDVQIDAFYTDCYSGGYLTPACTTFKTQNAACWQCIAPNPDTDSLWGPLVSSTTQSQAIFLNIGGCLLAKEKGNACGVDVHAQFECELASCSRCTSPASQYGTCFSNADQTTCATQFATATKCTDGIKSSVGIGLACLAAVSQQAYVRAIVDAFCK